MQRVRKKKGTHTGGKGWKTYTHGGKGAEEKGSLGVQRVRKKTDTIKAGTGWQREIHEGKEAKDQRSMAEANTGK